VKVSVADFEPAVVGENVTWTVVVWPAGTVIVTGLDVKLN